MSMETMLKTAFEIQFFTNEKLEEYLLLIAANSDWSVDDIRLILNQAISDPIYLNANNLYHLLVFLKERDYIIKDGDYKLSVAPFTDSENSTIYAFKWEFDSTYYVAFLHSDEESILAQAIKAIDDDDSISQCLDAIDADVDLNRVDHRVLAKIGIIVKDFIEPNPESLLIKENTARFSGAMWYNAIQDKVITLAGVGGIGSYVGFLLSRMHPKSIFVYDDDKVEYVNMSGQWYGKSDIGAHKVDALARAVINYSDYQSMFAISNRFTDESSASDIMICGFDSMEARKVFFNKWKYHVMSKNESERKHCLFIDGRLAAEDLQVLCITGDNNWGIEKYEREFLFSDDEADETICSYKQTTYMANMIGSIIVNLFTNFVANELVGAPIRSLSFFTSYDGVSMQIRRNNE